MKWFLTFLMVCSAWASQSVTVAWEPSVSPDVVGYYVYIGTESNALQRSAIFHTNTTATIGALEPGSTYYIAVTAMSADGEESDFSNVIEFTVPGIIQPAEVTVWLQAAENLEGPWTNMASLCWTSPSTGFWRAKVEFSK